MQDEIMRLNIGKTQKIGVLKFYEFFEFSSVRFNLSSYGLNLTLCVLNLE